MHQVDNPAFDRHGNLYVTYSGSRGQQAPVSIFRVPRDGTREPFVSDLSNPTSMALDPDGQLYVSSRFDGSVYRVERRRARRRSFASDLGVACGLAFASDGAMFVGDRSGTIFRVDGVGRGAGVRDAAAERGRVSSRVRSGRRLYVAAPTLGSHDVIIESTATGIEFRRAASRPAPAAGRSRRSRIEDSPSGSMR